MAARRHWLHRLLGPIVTLFIAGTLGMTAHAAISAHSAPAVLSTLRLSYYAGIPSLAPSLDPAHIQASSDYELALLVNANLVHILPTGEVRPDLATYTISKNHLTYTFTMRSNARFSNGHPVTAQDAAFSLERALAPSTHSEVADIYENLIVGADDYYRGKTHVIPGVKVLSRRVLQITITKPVAYFLDALSYPSADVLDPSVVRGKDVGAKNNYLTNTCVGNQGAGPFRFVCKSSGSTIHSFYAGRSPRYTLVPNPFYYGPKPRLRIELPGTSAQDNGYRAYEANALDMTEPVPPVYLGRWQGSKELRQYPSSVVVFLVPNTHMAPFDNVHCRLAVAYAIDRRTVADDLEGGTVRPTYALVPKGLLGYYPGADNPSYSPAAARAQLARCPSRTVPIALKYGDYTPDSVNSAKAVAAQLLQVGLNVKLTSLPPSAIQQTISHSLDTTHTQLVWSFWVQDYPDPQDYCTLLLRSGQPLNVGLWSNRQYDHLVDRAEVEMNPAVRAALYIRAQHLALSQGALITIASGISYELIKPYVHGLVTTEAYVDAVAKALDWTKVSISSH
jgi:peptide/nickel transport system substrate-binding protein/oligopeptide transport system substrate-binding protein